MWGKASVDRASFQGEMRDFGDCLGGRAIPWPSKRGPKKQKKKNLSSGAKDPWVDLQRKGQLMFLNSWARKGFGNNEKSLRGGEL